MGDTGRAQIVGWALAAVILAVAAVHFLGGGGGSDPAGAGVSLDGGPGAGGQPRGGSGGGDRRAVYVHVTGAVRRPGLYRVPAGSRVAVAVRRAGGPTRRADPVGLNFAAPVEDGQQVVVPVRGQAMAATGAGAAAGAGAAGSPGSAPGAPGQKIQLSTATPEQLDGIDGIGPTLAKRIIEYRDRHGGFKSVGELRQVEGIGEKRFATLRKSLRP
jgi:competence protein ComEA